MTARTRITPRERGQHEDSRAPRWYLSLDDSGGNAIEHTHDDFGHGFPMTERELKALADQIAKAIGYYAR